MRLVPFGEKLNKKAIVCLGGFDSIHRGHKRVIGSAVQLKDKYNAECSVFTFSNDAGRYTGKSEGLVFTFEERLLRLSELGVDEVIYADFSPEFANLSPLDFLAEIADNRPIAAFVCGKDYKFGKNAAGDTSLLREFCKERSIELHVQDFVEVDGNSRKVSTTMIKQFLSAAEIQSANDLLGDRYFIKGIVERGRQVGRLLEFPTANLSLPSDKFKIKRGVYATAVAVGNRLYSGVTNYGCAPTFNNDKLLVESYIDGFSGDIYGQEIIVYFNRFIRDIVKFNDVEELKEQLKKDVEVIR